MMRSVMAELVM